MPHKMHVKLTEELIQTTDKQYTTDSIAPGLRLCVRVGVSGAIRSWEYRYRSPVTGKRRNIGLGSICDRPLGEARKEIRKIRKMLIDGKDPIIEREKKREKELKMTPHTYRDGIHGRSVKVDIVTRQKHAHVICSTPMCGFVGDLKLKSFMPPEAIDKKFKQMGWQLDPHLCPECIEQRAFLRRAAKAAVPKLEARAPAQVPVEKKEEALVKEQIEMPTNDTMSEQLKPVSAATHKATAKMHGLLAIHFDPEKGLFEPGWSDGRVATESGLHPQYVSEVRDIAYGVLKEPTDFAEIRTQIRALHDLVNETLVAAQREVNQINERIDDLCVKLGFKPNK